MRTISMAWAVFGGVACVSLGLTSSANAQTFRSYTPAQCINLFPDFGSGSTIGGTIKPGTSDGSQQQFSLGSIFNAGGGNSFNGGNFLLCPVVNDSAVSAFTQQHAQLRGYATCSDGTNLGPVSVRTCRAFPGNFSGGVCGPWFTAAQNNEFTEIVNVGTEWSSGGFNDAYSLVVFIGEPVGAISPCDPSAVIAVPNYLSSYLTTQN